MDKVVEVMRAMGDHVTEGAINQHLSKMRSRRVALGLAVPPPLRRGGSGAQASASGTG